MRDIVKTLLKNGIGVAGDIMNEHISPVVLYQPKACNPGEILKEEKRDTTENKNKKDI